MVRCMFADIYFISEICKENQRKNMKLDHKFSDRHIFGHKKQFNAEIAFIELLYLTLHRKSN